ncbi:MAG: tetratricopeptide repeat protein, partial [Planctomycetota bacterium]
ALTVTRPTASEVIYGGSDLIVDWAAADANLTNAPVTIEWRRRPGEPWESMTGRGPYRAIGSEQWFTPLASGSLEVRVSCRDLAGNTTRWTTPEPIQVLPFDGFRGSRAIAAEPYSQFRQFPMHYRVTGFTPIEVGEVQVWVRTGYGSWRKEIDLDRATPYVFEAPEDGVYFFYLRVLSKNRDADRPAPGPDTPADYRVIVDTHPPQGELFVGVGGGNQAFTAGDPIEVQWSVFDENLDPTAAKLEVSLDGGASWQLLSHRLKTTDGRGSFRWRPPLIGSESTRFRLELRDLADNRIHVTHRSPVRLLNPRVDPKQTALDHYQHAMILARMKSDDRVGDRAQLLRALEHLEVALLYDPNLAEAWHDRGVILRMVGRYAQALESFQKSHRIRPAEVPFTFSLVRAHLDMTDQGLDSEKAHLARASSTFAVVTKETIYSYPPDEFRDLLATYKLLQAELKERDLAP